MQVLSPAGYVLLRGAASMNSAPGGSFMMTIAVFVRSKLEHHFSNVLVGRVTCGMGNKVSCPSQRLLLTCTAPARCVFNVFQILGTP